MKQYKQFNRSGEMQPKPQGLVTLGLLLGLSVAINTSVSLAVVAAERHNAQNEHGQQHDNGQQLHNRHYNRHDNRHQNHHNYRSGWRPYWGVSFGSPWYNNWGWNTSWNSVWGTQWGYNGWRTPYSPWNGIGVSIPLEREVTPVPIAPPERVTTSVQYLSDSSSTTSLPANARVIVRDGRTVYEWQNVIYAFDWDTQTYVAISH